MSAFLWNFVFLCLEKYKKKRTTPNLYFVVCSFSLSNRCKKNTRLLIPENLELNTPKERLAFKDLTCSTSN